MSEPSRSARGPNFEIKTICAELWQRHRTPGKEDGQIEMAGEANGYCFYDLLALPTDPPQEKEHAAQRSALAVVGRAGTAFKMEDTSARNLPENAARTHHPLHAVLGGFSP